MSTGPVRGAPSSSGRIELLNQTLRNLQGTSPDIEASALISDEGLMIASALSPHLDEPRIAGISATLSNVSARASKELERGDLREVFIRGEDGYAMMAVVTAGTLLLCLTRPGAKLGLIFLGMRRSADEIRCVL